jgi:predicted permease
MSLVHELELNEIFKVMESSKMKKHVTVVGSIHIGFGVLGLMAAIVVLVALSFARAFVGDDDVAQTVLGFLSVSIPILIGSVSALGLIAGIGLLVYKPWARYLVIILSIIDCVNIPIGTAIGIYSIWVLIQDDTVKLFTEEESKKGPTEPLVSSVAVQ